jgi:hypothetical protein
MNNEPIQWSPGMSLESLEKTVILKAYNFYKKNKTATANSLGIAIRTLDSKLEKYELDELVEKERQDKLEQQRKENLIRARGNPPNNIGVIYSPNSNVFSSAKDAASHALSRALAGPRMESIANSAAQQAVSMSERQEVQTVLSRNTSKGGKDRAR